MSTQSIPTSTAPRVEASPPAPGGGHDIERRDDTATGPLVSEHGTTSIADVVVEKIAGMAAREVPGVHKLGGGTARTIGAIRDRIPGQKASIGQGVAVEVGQRQAAIDLVLVAEYGVSIVEVSESVRNNVISSIEEMTGLEVTEVNIAVDDIHLPDDADDEDGDSNSNGQRVQ